MDSYVLKLPLANTNIYNGNRALKHPRDAPYGRALRPSPRVPKRRFQCSSVQVQPKFGRSRANSMHCCSDGAACPAYTKRLAWSNID